MTDIGKYWRTGRHLRPSQIIGRIYSRFQPASPDLRPAPPRRQAGGVWVTPARRESSFFPPARFRFLSVTRDLEICGWDDPNVDRLWRYNLHYFDDLNAHDSDSRSTAHRALIQRWLRANPPGLGTGWEPYPVSLRVVNWIKWFNGGVEAEPGLLHSLAVQARWLRARLEVHLLGNHLFSNAKALIMAGLFFEGGEAERWLDSGLKILRAQLPEQILADGGHFERSPMYHALAVEDLLDLLNAAALLAPADARLAEIVIMLRVSATRMLHWLRCMTHPDGSLAQFNDCADGIAPSIAEIERYAAELNVSADRAPADAILHLSASGYVRVSRGDAVAVLDVAPVGPDYLPAHAHADTLSFELSLGNQRVVVNGGTSTYAVGARREHERGTAAHSTVQVGNADSSEMWSSFRVGRRARPSQATLAGWSVECSHDGYRFLPRSPVHSRSWRFGLRELTVEDRVTPVVEPAVARFILAPGLRLHALAGRRWQVRSDDGALAHVDVVCGEAAVERTSHAPSFGVVIDVDCLRVGLEEGRACTRWQW